MTRTPPALAVLLWLCACPAPSPGPGPIADAGPSPVDAGPDFRDGGLPGLPLGAWQWVPLEGTKCGSGATAGLGVNLGPSTRELLVFFQGGGACWNQGSCVPSLLSFGPVCDYGTVCVWDVPGGQRPTANWVTHPDPYPADGGGAFPQDLAQLSTSVLLHRDRPDNPFKDATWVFVPYCTGDLHAGDAERAYQFKTQLFDPPSPFTMHFAGRKNVEVDLAWLTRTLPGLSRVWVMGSSAGGYGAQFNFARFEAAFPGADLHLLADSAPLIDTYHWPQWRDAWNVALPSGCAGCDAGLPAWSDHLAQAFPAARQALLSTEKDKVISWYFLGGTGTDPVLNPPTGLFSTRLGTLTGAMGAHGNTAYFLAAGEEHVLIGGVGLVLADGGVTKPVTSRDAGVQLDRFVQDWAQGTPGWSSAP